MKDETNKTNPMHDTADGAWTDADDQAVGKLFSEPVAYDDADAFTRQVIDRWQAEQSSPIAGRIGVRSIGLALVWAAALALLVTLTFWQSPQERIEPVKQGPAVGVLVQNVNKTYSEQSARIGRMVDMSTTMMDLDNMVDLLNRSLPAQPTDETLPPTQQ